MLGQAHVADDLEMLGLGDKVAGGSSPREGPQEEEQVWGKETMSSRVSDVLKLWFLWETQRRSNLWSGFSRETLWLEIEPWNP